MKKLVSILLVLCMLSSMTICAFADEIPTTEEQPAEPFVAIPVAESVAEPVEEPVEEPAEEPAPLADVNFSDETNDSSTHTTLQAAVDAAGEDGTVSVETEDTTQPVDANSGVVVDESVTIDLNGATVIIDETVGSSGTKTLGMQLKKEADEVIIEGEGGSIIFDGNSTGAENDDNENLKMGINNYTDLTLDNVTIDGRDLANYNSKGEYDKDYVNYVVSNNNGSLTVQNGASILADENDVAFDIYAYTSQGYTEGPQVTIAEDAGTIQGTIEFDGSANCAEAKLTQEPSLTIEGGTFTNFLLKIGNAVADFVDNIKISGGIFDSKKVVDGNGSEETYKFEQFVAEGHEVVQRDDGKWYVRTIVQASPDAPAEEVYVPVEEYVPEEEEEDEVVYAPAPAPAPKETVEVVAAEVVVAEPVAVEVNGTAVELSIVAEDIKTEVVSPAAAGEAAELKVVIDPTALEVEGTETAVVLEAVAATITVEVKDGDTVAADDYEITVDENGELKIELSAEYLEALGKGTHIIVVKIGGIEIEFTVVIK